MISAPLIVVPIPNPNQPSVDGADNENLTCVVLRDPEIQYPFVPELVGQICAVNAVEIKRVLDLGFFVDA